MKPRPQLDRSGRHFDGRLVGCRHRHVRRRLGRVHGDASLDPRRDGAADLLRCQRIAAVEIDAAEVREGSPVDALRAHREPLRSDGAHDQRRAHAVETAGSVDVRVEHRAVARRRAVRAHHAAVIAAAALDERVAASAAVEQAALAVVDAIAVTEQRVAARRAEEHDGERELQLRAGAAHRWPPATSPAEPRPTLGVTHHAAAAPLEAAFFGAEK